MWAKAAKMQLQARYELYVKPWDPELVMMEMCVLSQVISVSLHELNWSVHRHIHSKIRNRLEPASTEML